MTADTSSANSAKGLLIAAGLVLAVGIGVAWFVWPSQKAPDGSGKTTSEALTSDAAAPTAQTAEAPPDESSAEQGTPDVQTDVSDPEGDSSGFDVVRVDPDGSAVVAGHAKPGSTIQLTLDGAPLENVEVGNDGNFVALVEIPTAKEGALGITSLDDSGEVIKNSESEQTVLIAPVAPIETPAQTDVIVAEAPQTSNEPETVTPETTTPESEDIAEAPAAPQVLLTDDEGIIVLQDGTGRPAAENVVIDAITYDDAGEVALSGRGQGGSNLRVYLNNTPIDTGEILENGQWRLSLPEVESGVYTLRVDELAQDGTVTSRTETPFKREEPAQLAAVAQAKPDGGNARIDAVTVQPGSTLWAIAREHLGEGPLFVRVFAANKDKIRDPDLIYPGQVFAIPQEN